MMSEQENQFNSDNSDSDDDLFAYLSTKVKTKPKPTIVTSDSSTTKNQAPNETVKQDVQDFENKKESSINVATTLNVKDIKQTIQETKVESLEPYQVYKERIVEAELVKISKPKKSVAVKHDKHDKNSNHKSELSKTSKSLPPKTADKSKKNGASLQTANSTVEYKSQCTDTTDLEEDEVTEDEVPRKNKYKTPKKKPKVNSDKETSIPTVINSITREMSAESWSPSPAEEGKELISQRVSEYLASFKTFDKYKSQNVHDLDMDGSLGSDGGWNNAPSLSSPMKLELSLIEQDVTPVHSPAASIKHETQYDSPSKVFIPSISEGSRPVQYKFVRDGNKLKRIAVVEKTDSPCKGSILVDGVYHQASLGINMDDPGSGTQQANHEVNMDARESNKQVEALEPEESDGFVETEDNYESDNEVHKDNYVSETAETDKIIHQPCALKEEDRFVQIKQTGKSVESVSEVHNIQVEENKDDNTGIPDSGISTDSDNQQDYFYATVYNSNMENDETENDYNAFAYAENDISKQVLMQDNAKYLSNEDYNHVRNNELPNADESSIIKKTDTDFVQYLETACLSHSENASNTSKVSLCSDEGPIVIKLGPDGKLSECKTCPASHNNWQEKKTEMDISFLTMRIQKIEHELLEMKRKSETDKVDMAGTVMGSNSSSLPNVGEPNMTEEIKQEQNEDNKSEEDPFTLIKVKDKRYMSVSNSEDEEQLPSPKRETRSANTRQSDIEVKNNDKDMSANSQDRKQLPSPKRETRSANTRQSDIEVKNNDKNMSANSEDRKQLPSPRHDTRSANTRQSDIEVKNNDKDMSANSQDRKQLPSPKRETRSANTRQSDIEVKNNDKNMSANSEDRKQLPSPRRDTRSANTRQSDIEVKNNNKNMSLPNNEDKEQLPSPRRDTRSANTRQSDIKEKNNNKNMSLPNNEDKEQLPSPRRDTRSANTRQSDIEVKSNNKNMSLSNSEDKEQLPSPRRETRSANTRQSDIKEKNNDKNKSLLNSEEKERLPLPKRETRSANIRESGMGKNVKVNTNLEIPENNDNMLGNKKKGKKQILPYKVKEPIESSNVTNSEKKAQSSESSVGNPEVTNDQPSDDIKEPGTEDIAESLNISTSSLTGSSTDESSAEDVSDYMTYDEGSLQTLYLEKLAEVKRIQTALKRINKGKRKHGDSTQTKGLLKEENENSIIKKSKNVDTKKERKKSGNLEVENVKKKTETRPFIIKTEAFKTSTPKRKNNKSQSTVLVNFAKNVNDKLTSENSHDTRKAKRLSRTLVTVETEKVKVKKKVTWNENDSDVKNIPPTTLSPESDMTNLSEAKGSVKLENSSDKDLDMATLLSLKNQVELKRQKKVMKTPAIQIKDETENLIKGDVNGTEELKQSPKRSPRRPTVQKPDKKLVQKTKGKRKVDDKDNRNEMTTTKSKRKAAVKAETVITQALVNNQENNEQKTGEENNQGVEIKRSIKSEFPDSVRSSSQTGGVKRSRKIINSDNEMSPARTNKKRKLNENKSPSVVKNKTELTKLGNQSPASKSGFVNVSSNASPEKVNGQVDKSPIKSQEVENKRQRLETIISKKLKCVQEVKDEIKEIQVDDSIKATETSVEQTDTASSGNKSGTAKTKVKETKHKSSPKTKQSKPSAKLVIKKDSENTNKKANMKSDCITKQNTSPGIESKTVESKPKQRMKVYKRRTNVFVKSHDQTWKENLNNNAFSAELLQKNDSVKKRINVKRLIKNILDSSDSSKTNSKKSDHKRHKKRRRHKVSSESRTTDASHGDTNNKHGGIQLEVTGDQHETASFPGMSLGDGQAKTDGQCVETDSQSGNTDSQCKQTESQHVVGAIAKPRNSSFNKAGVTGFCNSTDEVLVTHTDNHVLNMDVTRDRQADLTQSTLPSRLNDVCSGNNENVSLPTGSNNLNESKHGENKSVNAFLNTSAGSVSDSDAAESSGEHENVQQTTKSNIVEQTSVVNRSDLGFNDRTRVIEVHCSPSHSVEINIQSSGESDGSMSDTGSPTKQSHVLIGSPTKHSHVLTGGPTKHSHALTGSPTKQTHVLNLIQANPTKKTFDQIRSLLDRKNKNVWTPTF